MRLHGRLGDPRRGGEIGVSDTVANGETTAWVVGIAGLLLARAAAADLHLLGA